MDDDARLELSKDVVHMMFGLTGRLRAHMHGVAASLDLTPMQTRALFLTQNPMPMGELAEALHCDASNVTGIVDRLEERGLLAREVDPADRRRRRLVPTSAGTAMTARLRELVHEDHPLLELDDADLATLHGLLERVEGPCECPGHARVEESPGEDDARG